MRVGVDAWRIHGHTGVPRYIENIINSWSSGITSTDVKQITLYTPEPIDQSRVLLNGSVKEQVIHSYAHQLVWQNTILSRVCDTDVLWCPAYVTPIFCRARIVVTTHDATNTIHPELYGLGDRVFYKYFYGWCARHATLVITNNNQTRADIQNYYGVPGDRIRVVPLAPAQIFRKLENDEDANATRLRLIGDYRPYFLSVGKISGRRNVPLVIEGFARFREKTGLPHRLVVVGRSGLGRNIGELAKDFGLSEHLIHIDYVTDEELLHLYNGTEAFVTAATYEANSLTTIEAQVCGAPVVIPDVPGMVEMTAGIAVILPQVGAKEISEAMEKLATEHNLHRRLSEEGHIHASGFSWGNTSQGILSVLEEAADISSPALKESK
jgi:glycosyltransferase involved in cell wall biosynthesis